MKKMKQILVFALLLSLMITACGKKELSYQEIVDSFPPVSAKEIKTKQEEGQEFFVYLGREDCPYCVEFVPVFKEIADKQKYTVHTLDTTVDQEEYEAFLEEMQVKYVPALYYIHDKEIKDVDIGDKYTVESVTKAIGEAKEK